ncbi:MAG: hypothetical protein LBC07_06110 [Elusimicrobiota bacterium]|jgi:phosphopantothenoylcysteine synthetase/decarboxylase|nr:hypothetical protein [Elusimicrobiota bacterium]
MPKLNFLILSGPTREYIDPVRFITNESSGKMGQALANAVLAAGHKLTFITGPAAFLPETKSSNLNIINVMSALEMFKALKENFKQADIIISAAAIADFRVKKISKHKIKKSADLTLELIKNPDLISFCGKHKKQKVVVGFALETQKLLENAKKKLLEKNLDLIVANTQKSFGADISAAYILSRDKDTIKLLNVSKDEIARRIVDESVRIFKGFKHG